MKKSEFVCEICGLSVHGCGKGDGSVVWKHANSGTTGKLSCGRPPRLITRIAFEEGISSISGAIKEMCNNQNKRIV